VKKLSILIYSLASGGAERVISILLNQLKDRYDITLYLMNDTIFYNIPKNLKITYLENSDSKESGIKKLLKLPILAWKYKKLNNSDISLSFMNRPNYINILAKLFGMKSKVLISERIAPSQEYKTNTLKDKISRFLIKNLYSKANLIIPNAEGIKSDLINNFEIDKNLIKVINNPVDIEKIENLKKEEVEFRDKTFSFITIGRMQYQKNHKLLIDAIKDIDAKLYIIGDGELRYDLELKIDSLELLDKVVLLGRQSNPYKYISQADCFVFSSNYEGFPNVLLEALACGLPVISTDCQSGPREILAPNSDINFQLQESIEKVEYGILTAVNDKDSLIEAMNIMINDKQLREKYKNSAKIRAKDFDVDKIIKKFISCLK
jgi:N-acetylgalactosamine-N,N'-diacetylbacillosaminyl-diphospho-undecaprenol 4-alpha-N-acetylgalactosaminyltransferase